MQTGNAKLKNRINKIKKVFLGKNVSDGLLAKIVVYALLIFIGFVYLYPLLTMLSTSLKSSQDLIDPNVTWIPTKFYFENFKKAAVTLNYFPTFFRSLLVTLFPALIQTTVTSVIGYGLARFEFKGKKVLLILILASFVIPQQVYTIPKYVMFNQFHLLYTPFAIIIPALFGQGVNSAIFVLIFYQFFKMVPKALDEAAEIDGAGPWKRFFLVGIPLASQAFITCFLFGLVWYWNETYIAGLFLSGSGSTKWYTLQLRLAEFDSMYRETDELAKINEGIKLSATILIILPMLLVYFALQKGFVEGVERTGLTGE